MICHTRARACDMRATRARTRATHAPAECRVGPDTRPCGAPATKAVYRPVHALCTCLQHVHSCLVPHGTRQRHAHGVSMSIVNASASAHGSLHSPFASRTPAPARVACLSQCTARCLAQCRRSLASQRSLRLFARARAALLRQAHALGRRLRRNQHSLLGVKRRNGPRTPPPGAARSSTRPRQAGDTLDGHIVLSKCEKGASALPSSSIYIVVVPQAREARRAVSAWEHHFPEER